MPTDRLGTSWQGPGASTAYAGRELKSTDGGNRLRIAFRNLSAVPLILCWVSESGDLHHFYKLSPSLRSENDEVSEGDHIEHTAGGHAFCLAHVPENELADIRKNKKLKDTNTIIAVF